MDYYFTCSLTCRVARANLFARGELTKALCLRPLANKFASATQKLFGQQALTFGVRYADKSMWLGGGGSSEEEGGFGVGFFDVGFGG